MRTGSKPDGSKRVGMKRIPRRRKSDPEPGRTEFDRWTDSNRHAGNYTEPSGETDVEPFQCNTSARRADAPMIAGLFAVFADVVAPVFGIVLAAFLAGPRLGLQARTLSRTAYYIFIPAFVFEIIRPVHLGAADAFRMVAYIAAVHLTCAATGFATARLLGRSRETVAAFVLIAVFGNTGNFGLSLIEFRLGHEGMVSATIYFLGLTVITFAVGVGAATWARGGSMRAVLAVFRTPALLAFAVAMAVNLADAPVPLFATRMTGLLSGAMIPTMLVSLGVQLAEAGRPRLTTDLAIASGLRLLAGPAIAFVLAGVFGIEGLARSTGILQSAMPAAVLTAVIASEHRLLPDFVTHTVLVSTALSFLTLTVLLALV
jgi:malate permease and related proteins